MGMLKNRLILTAMMLALPLAGLVFFGLLTEHNFNTLPYYTVDGPMAVSYTHLRAHETS